MSRNAEGGITIIKRRRPAAQDAHHGGAWKVAYADFVTAMMAFFLLMWLLSVSDDEMKAGLADYFSPTIPIYQTRTGGDGPFEGESLFSQNALTRDETGQAGDPDTLDRTGTPDDRSLWDIQRELMGASGDASEADPLLKHIATRVTDEGLIIEVFDIEGSPLFAGDTLETNPVFGKLMAMIGRVLALTGNDVAVAGHLAPGDIPTDGTGVWELSAGRAQLARQDLHEAGILEPRFARVTGHADRKPTPGGKAGSRNRRLEITLLRSFGQER